MQSRIHVHPCNNVKVLGSSMPGILGSLVLLRRLRISSTNGGSQLSKIFRGRPFSASSSEQTPTSLSDRMSFLFDQIDKLERERADKDQTLKRIRAWRQSKDNPQPLKENRERPLDSKNSENAELRFDVPTSSSSHHNHQENNEVEQPPTTSCKGIMVEVAHPWPEWIELMERLAQQNYFVQQRRIENDDENAFLESDQNQDIVSIESDSTPEAGVVLDLNDAQAVQKACLNFGKDRFDILKSLSRRDIQVLVGYGCPNYDRRTLFSSKLLRKYTHLDEGDVCSNCSMRSTCDKAYLLTNKFDEARTVDLMRVLLGYGLDATHGTVTNKPLLKQKQVRTVVRKLLHEIVKLSSVPIDPNLPRPVIRMAPPKVKQPPPTPKKRVGRMDAELKKGDWICTKCQFLNFAKNTVCLQCNANRPKRQLQPGEWECPQCNFLNYRRNMVCFHCECKRPLDDFVDDRMEQKQSPKADTKNIVKRADVSGSWNFNFDDDESDGADVAAFEYADSASKPGGKVEWDGKSKEDDANVRSGIGFDDFDDYSIDDLEIDTNYSDRKLRPDDNAGGEFGPRDGISRYEQRRTGLSERRSGYGSGEESEYSVDRFGSGKTGTQASRQRSSFSRSDDRGSRNFVDEKVRRRNGYGNGDDEESDDSDDELEPRSRRATRNYRRADGFEDDFDDAGTRKMRTRDSGRRNAVPAGGFKEFRTRKDFGDERRFQNSRGKGYAPNDFKERYGVKNRDNGKDFGEFRNSRRIIER